jgi:hypothetical protein
MKTAALLLSLALGTMAIGQRTVEVEEPIWLVRAEVLIVRLPEARALEMQPELRDPQRVAAGQQKLLEMIRKKEATLVDWPIVTGKPGVRATVENVQEVRFGVYRDKKGEEVENEKPEARDETRLPVSAPTSFESKAVGVSFEFDSNVTDDGKGVEVELISRYVDLSGFVQKTMSIDGKYTVVRHLPEFQVRGDATTLTLQSGQPHLLGFHKLREPEGTVELVVVTFTISEVGKQKVLREVPAGREKAGPEPKK